MVSISSITYWGYISITYLLKEFLWPTLNICDKVHQVLFHFLLPGNTKTLHFPSSLEVRPQSCDKVRPMDWGREKFYPSKVKHKNGMVWFYSLSPFWRNLEAMSSGCCCYKTVEPSSAWDPARLCRTETCTIRCSVWEKKMGEKGRFAGVLLFPNYPFHNSQEMWVKIWVVLKLPFGCWILLL